MHTKAFITFARGNAECSQDARSYTFETLVEQGFCSSGRFSSGPSDWFVIGGRCTGELQLLSKENNFYNELKRQYGIDASSSEDTLKRNRDKIQSLWEKMGFKHENPYARDSHKDYGYEDDAMIVTRRLYNRILKPYEGESEHEGYFWDLECEPVSKDFIGRKWVVVVDYHC